jgi:hypothetical protein
MQQPLDLLQCRDFLHFAHAERYPATVGVGLKGSSASTLRRIVSHVKVEAEAGGATFSFGLGLQLGFVRQTSCLALYRFYFALDLDLVTPFSLN